MLLVYLFVTYLCIIISRLIYKQKINPISLYCVLWFICFFFHESGIIYFLPISINTFIMIIIGNISVVVGCWIGSKLSNIKIKHNCFKDRSLIERDFLMIKWISILSLICGIDVLIKFIQQISMYGANIFANFAYRYSSQIREVQESDLDVSSLVFPLVVLLGIYIVKNGVNRNVIMPVCVIILFSLIQGSRGTLIIVMALFISQITVLGGKKKINGDMKENKNRRKLMFLFLILVIVVLLITISRNQYFSESSSSYSSNNIILGALESIASYTAEGIGCLDKYMEQPIKANYPQYFFRVPIIILNKLGVTNLDTRYHIPTYYIPEPSNVITYIGELYHDFGMLYGIVIAFLACIFSYVYKKSTATNNIFYRMSYSAFFAMFSLSFFANFFHSASLWYVIIIGGIISFTIDKKIFKI